MATTSRPFEVGSLGVRNTAGAVVASAKVRWYSPGTLTPATAYTDAACTTPATAPLTANAAGQFTLYFLEPVRVIIKDTLEAVTYYDDIAALNRHDSLYITHTSFNGGAETTLEAILTSLGTNLGTDGNYKESAGATAVSYVSWLGALAVSVKDFGATGDGTTDDTTAIQAASDRVEARGGGWVYFPKGTYRVNSAITIDTAGVSWMGAGRGVSILKNFGTTTNVLTVNVSGDCKAVFRDFSITANTTSSGAGISFTAGNNARIERVGVSLHRTGINAATPTGTSLADIVIDTTDDNASSVGVSLGAQARLRDSNIQCGTANGTAVVASGTDALVTGTYTNNWSTGITLSGTDSQANSCTVSGAVTGVLASGTDAKVRNTETTLCTTGVSLTGARASALGCSSRSNTTGYSLGVANAATVGCTNTSGTTGFTVGAFASCRVVECASTSATTDLSVNASATLLVEHSNVFTTISDSATTPHSWLKDRGKVLKITKSSDSAGSPTFTPTPATCDVFVANLTGAGSGTLTIAASSTTGLVDGQQFRLIIQNNAAASTSLSFNAQWVRASTSISSLANARSLVYDFTWRAAANGWLEAEHVALGTESVVVTW